MIGTDLLAPPEKEPVDGLAVAAANLFEAMTAKRLAQAAALHARAHHRNAPEGWENWTGSGLSLTPAGGRPVVVEGVDRRPKGCTALASAFQFGTGVLDCAPLVDRNETLSLSGQREQYDFVELGSYTLELLDWTHQIEGPSPRSSFLVTLRFDTQAKGFKATVTQNKPIGEPVFRAESADAMPAVAELRCELLHR